LRINDNILNLDPRFLSIKEHNYGLDTLSAAKDKAKMLSPPLDFDVLGRLRSFPPDIGAFESQK